MRAPMARVEFAFALAGMAATPAAAQAAQGRKPVPAARPRVTRDAKDQGATPEAAKQSLRVCLAPRGGEDALKAAVAAVSTPGSASYGQYLTAQQFHAQWDPTAATVKTGQQWLKCEGLKVPGVEAHNRYVTVTGDASAAEAAFATTLHQYTQGGDTFQAPTQTATVPADVAGAIIRVSGLASHAPA